MSFLDHPGGFGPGGIGPIAPIPGFDTPDAVSVRDPYAKPGVLTPPGARPRSPSLGS